MASVNIAEAKARLSELIEQSLNGETVTVMRRGKPLVTLVPVAQPRRKIDLARLRAMTDGMTFQKESAGDFMRRLRDESPY